MKTNHFVNRKQKESGNLRLNKWSWEKVHEHQKLLSRNYKHKHGNY